jgi:hypothetical protein
MHGDHTGMVANLLKSTRALEGENITVLDKILKNVTETSFVDTLKQITTIREEVGIPTTIASWFKSDIPGILAKVFWAMEVGALSFMLAGITSGIAMMMRKSYNTKAVLAEFGAGVVLFALEAGMAIFGMQMWEWMGVMWERHYQAILGGLASTGFFSVMGIAYTVGKRSKK